jgi:hypothetical protein
VTGPVRPTEAEHVPTCPFDHESCVAPDCTCECHQPSDTEEPNDILFPYSDDDAQPTEADEPQGVVSRPSSPSDAECCPRCGSTNITCEDTFPPKRCNECGDQWAGIYRPDPTEADEHLPAGLLISEDGALLNWQGVNYERQVTPTPADDCATCGEGIAPNSECPKSKRPCGHHCNHSWEQDHCHWCDQEIGEDHDDVLPALNARPAPLPTAGSPVMTWMASGGNGTAAVVSKPGAESFSVFQRGEPALAVAEMVAAALRYWDASPPAPLPTAEQIEAWCIEHRGWKPQDQLWQEWHDGLDAIVALTGGALSRTGTEGDDRGQ